MTQAEFIARFANNIGSPKVHVEDMLSALKDTVKEVLTEGEEVVLPGLGKFRLQDRPARKGRNPQTGAAVDIPAKRVVKFKPAKALSELVAYPRERPLTKG